MKNKNKYRFFAIFAVFLLIAGYWMASCGSGMKSTKIGEGGLCSVTQDCEEGLVCEEGICTRRLECPPGRDPCGGICCEENQVCDAGTCVDSCLYEICNGQCCGPYDVCTQDGCCARTKVCAEGCCNDDEFCYEGECIACPYPLCEGQCCAEGEMCHRGTCCLPDNICGGECCGDDEICEFEECHRDCGDLVRCGEAEECCDADEICYFGECITPGDPCDDAYDCGPDEYCDIELGLCLPRHETTECEYRPPAGEFTPEEDWAWTGGDVMMTPAVGNLTDDNGDGTIDENDIPDVAFTVFYGGDYHFNGTLYVISGDDGSEHFSVSSPRISPGGGVAIADVDSDGSPDIAACKSGGGLVVLDNTGGVKWDPGVGCIQTYAYEHPAVADLEGDGAVEVVVDYTIVSGGAFRCSGWSDSQRIPAIYDLDKNGTLDIVGGNRAMDSDCAELWHNTDVNDGYPAIADIDGDTWPDVVTIRGNIWILSGTTGDIMWGPYAIPGGGGGGAPTIADFDGDTLPEIATAGLDYYVVFDPDCSDFRDGDCASGAANGILWTRETQDHSSSQTGSSVFDFEGDGIAEVVYGDEYYLRIYAGVDGEVLFEVPNSSGTLFEYPLIVDVDNDEHAEIVVVSNDYAWGSTQGVRAFSDALDNWVRTRRIWNEHTYHITNINEDGSVPTGEVPNYTVEGFNNFRQNVQPEGLFNAPDLVPEDTLASEGLCPSKLLLSVRVLNQGTASAPEGIPVAFYIVESAVMDVLLGVRYTTHRLMPGASEVLTLEFDLPSDGMGELFEFYVVVDSDGEGGERVPHECREENNTSDPFTGYCELIG